MEHTPSKKGLETSRDNYFFVVDVGIYLFSLCRPLHYISVTKRKYDISCVFELFLFMNLTIQLKIQNCDLYQKYSTLVGSELFKN